MNLYGDLIGALLDDGKAHKATRFMGNNRTIVATRRFYRGRPGKRQIEVLITDGRPNYENRQRIKKARKAGGLMPTFVLEYPPGKKR